MNSIAELWEAQKNGGGLCTKCGGKLDFYYQPWCPICEKPELVPVPTLNLIKALRHICVLDNDDEERFKDRFWRRLCDESDFRNDSYFSYYFQEDPEDEGYADDMRFKEVFGITGDSVVFEVSW